MEIPDRTMEVERRGTLEMLGIITFGRDVHARCMYAEVTSVATP